MTASTPARSRTARQLVWFTVIGVAATVAYLALYAALRGVLGAQAANLLAWVLTAAADNSANRRMTFGVAHREGAGRAQAEGMLLLLAGLALTSGSLSALEALVPAPPAALELAVLVGANLAAGVLLFVLLRAWVFRPGRGRGVARLAGPATRA